MRKALNPIYFSFFLFSKAIKSNSDNKSGYNAEIIRISAMIMMPKQYLVRQDIQ